LLTVIASNRRSSKASIRNRRAKQIRFTTLRGLSAGQFDEKNASKKMSNPSQRPPFN
jgi:hypothetical protein